jgi:hypothetical protein
MKYFPALLAVVVGTGLMACGGGVTLPPVSPDDVEVFMPGSFPDEDCKVMKTIQEDASLNTPDAEMVELAKTSAAEVGADAVIIDAIRRTTEGGIETNLQQEQRKIIDARACYYPSRHPELEGN